MKLIPTVSALKYQARIRAKLADAVAALRVADAKLEVAAAGYYQSQRLNGGLDHGDLLEAQFNAPHFADASWRTTARRR